MKGHKLLIKILAYLSILGGFIMVLLNEAPSWSQYFDLDPQGTILYATLSCMSSLFLIRSFTHPKKEEVLFEVPFIKKNVRFEHINRYTGFLFLGVLCAPVTSTSWYLITLHIIFTAAVIFTAYLQLWFYPKKDTVMKVSAGVSILIGLVGFVGGYFYQYYSTGTGELIIAFTIIGFILTTNK